LPRGVYPKGRNKGGEMMNEKGPLNLMVCGVGGQGNVLLSKLLARALVKKGYKVTVGETFGGSQRGGSVMSHVRVSKNRTYGPLIPVGKVHIILGLEPMETVRVLCTYGNPDVVVISNVRPIYPITCVIGVDDYPSIEEMKRVMREMSAKQWFLDATQISLEMGNPILLNMIMIGVLIQANVVNLSKPDMDGIIRETFPDKTIEVNIEALNRGMLAIQSQRFKSG
jgi:indolepyruvate ferredoxin oxidoreductase beta subunit